MGLIQSPVCVEYRLSGLLKTHGLSRTFRQFARIKNSARIKAHHAGLGMGAFTGYVYTVLPALNKCVVPVWPVTPGTAPVPDKNQL
jgi:hypothetical protein